MVVVVAGVDGVDGVDRGRRRVQDEVLGWLRCWVLAVKSPPLLLLFQLPQPMLVDSAILSHCDRGWLTNTLGVRVARCDCACLCHSPFAPTTTSRPTTLPSAPRWSWTPLPAKRAAEPPPLSEAGAGMTKRTTTSGAQQGFRAISLPGWMTAWNNGLCESDSSLCTYSVVLISVLSPTCMQSRATLSLRCITRATATDYDHHLQAAAAPTRTSTTNGDSVEPTTSATTTSTSTRVEADCWQPHWLLWPLLQQSWVGLNRTPRSRRSGRGRAQRAQVLQGRAVIACQLAFAARQR